MERKLPIVLCLFAFLLSNVSKAQVPTAQRDALIDLYNATNGAGWSVSTNWTVGDPSTWYGVTVDVSDNVTSVILENNNLSGTLPDISDLAFLKTLRLEQNDIDGDIADILGYLPDIRILDLGRNNIDGSLPSTIENMSSLVELSLGDNDITGTIPSEIGNVPLLKFLRLHQNSLSGGIPTEIGDISTLEKLVLYSSGLNGSLPASLGSLSSLTDLQISNNQFNGSIPEEFSGLSSLTIFEAANNNLTGSIPDELGLLTTLRTLDLSGNSLSGEIPGSLGNLTILLTLLLNDNDLDGSIPGGLSGMAALETMKLNDNELSGSIPTGLGSIGTLETLWLNENNLDGSIPTELGSLAALEDLKLSNNALSGLVPASFGSLSNLEILHLNDNELSGALNANVASLGNLTEIQLHSNEFEDIPDFSGTGLLHLTLYDNYLTFEDLEPNVGIPGNTQMYQKFMIHTTPIDVDQGDLLYMEVSVGGSSNEYQWQKNNINISGAMSDSYFISSVELSDGGVYKLFATSPLVPGVTLVSVDIVVNVSFDTRYYYWVGNGGSWDDLNHWATESGGSVKHTELPRIVDDVIFDANSFTQPGQVVEVPDNGDNQGMEFHNMDWTGVQNNPEFMIVADKVFNPGGSGSDYLRVLISGSMVLSEDMTLNFVGCDFYFSGVEPYNVDTKGKYLGVNSLVTINSDSFSPFGSGNGPANIASDLWTEWILMFRGELLTNGHTVRAEEYFWAYGSDDKFLDISNSTIETAVWRIEAMDELTSTGSTITMLDKGSESTFEGFNLDYYDLVNEADQLLIKASNEFHHMTLGPGQEIRLQALKTQTIDDLIAEGTEAEPILIQSDNDGSPGFLAKTSGTVTVDWAELKDNYAVGGASFIATHSVDLGGLSGWTFACDVSASIDVTPETCNGTNDAIITITGADNAGTLTYSLDGGPYQPENTFENLAPDDYVVTVKDIFNCTESYPVTIDPATDPIWYADTDGDGLGDPLVSQQTCTQPVGYVDNDDDCDDTDADLPGLWYEDLDNDGYGDPAVSQLGCTAPAGFVADNTDCDPGDGSINPGETDTPGSGVDANCDGNYTWYIDQDGDGYAGTNTTTSTNSSPGAGEFAEALDCDDNDPDVKPGTVWYADEDGDGFGDASNSVTSCSPPANHVITAGDCDDSDESINPDGVEEAGTGVDANCDNMYLWYVDADGDGYAGATTTLSENQTPGDGEFAESTDCDDSDADVYPGAVALPDGKDNDCDGTVDKVAQEISLAPIDDINHLSVTSVEIMGTSTSGLAVSYSVTGPATISENVITITGIGEVTVNADQAGNDGYDPAPTESESFCVLPTPAITTDVETNSRVKLISNYLDGNQWYRDGELIEGATDATYFTNSSGSFVVEVSMGGCTGVSEAEEVVVTGLDLFANGSIEVFPNPMRNELRVSLNQTLEGYSIRLIDMTGKEMLRQKLNPSQRLVQLDVQHLNRGVYQLILENGQEASVMKVVKE